MAKKKGRPRKTVDKPKIIENKIEDDKIEISNELNNTEINENKSVIESPSDVADVKQETELSAPPTFRNPLERNLGSSMDVEFIYPHLKGYWAIEEDVQDRLYWGYEFCRKEWVKNYDRLFSHLSPAEGQNPNGHVTFREHILMVANEEIIENRRKFFQNRRQDPKNPAKGYVSQEEVRKMGLS